MIELPRIETSVSRLEAIALVARAAGQVVLEVGSWRGFSTVAMAQVAERVHAVDHHLGDDHAGHDESLSYLMANLDRFGVRDRVIVHVGDAAIVLPLLPAGLFDFAFIDGFHDLATVTRDAHLATRLLRPGGLLAFHDYGDPRFEVTAAVDSLDLRRVDLIQTLAIMAVDQ